MPKKSIDNIFKVSKKEIDLETRFNIVISLLKRSIRSGSVYNMHNITLL